VKHVAAIILAGGASQRMQGVDKVWSTLGGRPIIAHTLSVFEDFAPVESIVLVVAPDRRHEAAALGFRKVSAIVAGGPRRQDSARAGLAELAPAVSHVIVHDGARPFVTKALLEAGLEALATCGAAIPALPIADTVKEVQGDTVERSLDRTRLRAVQSPQFFSRTLLERAYAASAADADATDDALLVERLGERVIVFPGSPANIKITTPDDLLFARWRLG
jgi:2-C-methyl-D-erythritol 4-phosphate cytidylyltransferase